MSDKHWYIIQAYSNFERKVADSIREQAKQRHLDHLFEEIMVPKEKVVEVRRGRKVDAERKFFPGYVLVKMELSDEATRGRCLRGPRDRTTADLGPLARRPRRKHGLCPRGRRLYGQAT